MSDRLEVITAWLEPLLRAHKAQSGTTTTTTTTTTTLGPPFVLGLVGIQGCGKSTLVTGLGASLVSQGHRVVQFSLDDLYLPFDRLMDLQSGGNKLWTSRGQFGTHDVDLATGLFQQLRRNSGTVEIPSFDKPLHRGRGDRVPRSQWQTVDLPVDIVLFEGWGVGFQPLDPADLSATYQALKGDGQSQVARNSLEDLLRVNEALWTYCDTFMHRDQFDAMIVLQAQETRFVYNWRLQQEHAMWKVKGSGMSDDEVKDFIDRYYPSYELYLPHVLNGVFAGQKPGHQLNLIMDEHRRLNGTNII